MEPLSGKVLSVKIRYEPDYFEQTVTSMVRLRYAIEERENLLAFQRAKGVNIMDIMLTQAHLARDRKSFRTRLENIEESMPDYQFAELLLRLGF